MKVKDKMNINLICVDSKSSIYEAAQKMKEHNIGFLPIKENDEIIGIITDRDITILCVSNKDIESKIKNYMRSSVVYIDENKSVDDALSLMGKYQIKRLVVTKNNKGIGVISISDLLDYNPSKIVSTLKNIFTAKNEKKEETEIDEFYL